MKVKDEKKSNGVSELKPWPSYIQVIKIKPSRLSKLPPLIIECVLGSFGAV